jgi:thiol-disulfide isomerase/thioredoxin
MKKIFLFLVFIIFTNPAFSSENEGFATLKTTTFDGKIFDLKEKKGKVVIINFWAKWCGYCRQEMPILDELYKKYKSSNLEIIGISVDYKRSRIAAEKMAAQFSYPNSIIHDAKEISFEEPNTIPKSYVIDKEGKVKAVISGSEGEETKQHFESVIKPLLEK